MAAQRVISFSDRAALSHAFVSRIVYVLIVILLQVTLQITVLTQTVICKVTCNKLKTFEQRVCKLRTFEIRE